MTEEKRRFSRIKINRPVTLSFAGGPTFRNSTSEDLSVGGCLVASDHLTKIGAECSIAIFFDEQDKDRCIDIKGIVIRCERGVIGVKFTTITPENLFHLKNLIRFNTPDPERIDSEIQNRPGIV